MALICTCESTLPTQIDVTCPQDLDQIVKLAFQTKQDTVPFNATTSTIDAVDSWNTLLAVSDSTKIVLSPAAANTVITASEASRSGENSNESVNGLGYYLGEDNVRVTGEFHSIPQTVADALSELSCYSDPTLGSSNLTVFPFLRRIQGTSRVMAKNGAAAGEYKGFEIFNWRISSPDNQGYNTKTKYMWSFDMQPDEFKDFAVVVLGFNPLQLANVANP